MYKLRIIIVSTTITILATGCSTPAENWQNLMDRIQPVGTGKRSLTKEEAYRTCAINAKTSTNNVAVFQNYMPKNGSKWDLAATQINNDLQQIAAEDAAQLNSIRGCLPLFGYTLR